MWRTHDWLVTIRFPPLILISILPKQQALFIISCFSFRGRVLGENLCTAAARGYIKRLQSYRLAGANLSQHDFSGRTALHLSCLHGHKDVVEYLLKCSVDTAPTDHLKLTPYDYAVRNDQTEIVQILLENGIKPADKPMKNGGTPPSPSNGCTNGIK